MSAGQNHYKVDLRAINFTLYEHLNVQRVFEHERFSHLSREECDAIIEQCVRYATEVTGPLNGPADRVGCKLEDGTTVTPEGFQEAWKTLSELGLIAFSVEQEAGGFGGPMTYTSPSGRRLVVIATAKSQGDDAKLLAFGLPQPEER